MQRSYRNSKKNDDAISPVIGTILMVAATVIIAGAVYAAVNAYNGKAAKTGPEASFKAQAMDADGDGLEDTIKVTYLSGPSNADSVKVNVKNATDAAKSITASSQATWSPGDYQTFKPAAGEGRGSFYVTVLMGDTAILDQTVTLKDN